MGLTFEQPAYLLLILLAIPAAWIGLRWFNTMSRPRAWSALVMRTLLIALIAGILAGASTVQRNERLAVIAVVDISESVRAFADEFGDFGTDLAGNDVNWSGAVRQWLEDSATNRKQDDLLGIVVFDGSALAIATPTRGSLEGLTFDYRISQGSDIAGAIRFAESLFPPDANRRLVLISDGNETTGDAVGVAQELAAGAEIGATTPIDVLPITYAVQREVMVERVDAPPQAARDATVTVRVVLRAAEATTGTLDLLYEGDPVDINGRAPGVGRTVSLRAGRNIITLDVPLRDTTVHRFEPVFTPDDAAFDRLTTNNRAETFTITPGDGAIAIIDGTGQGRTAPLVQTLRSAGIDVRSLAPEALPTSLLGLQAYDLIMLDNVPQEALPRTTHRMLAEYVETLGGGLVMIGGPDSFGAGGWNGTDLEDVLPVELDLPEQIITPSAAIAFVIDSSGSMQRAVLGGSRSQQLIANEATALAIETLDKTDLVLVLAFDNATREVVPLARNSDPERSAATVRAISPGGGTNLYPALDRAVTALAEADANVKHVIVLSDGQSQGDPEMGYTIANTASTAGITVSTIAVGDDADSTALAGIALRGGGQFYHVFDPNTLPRIFIKEIRVVRQPLIAKGLFRPIVLTSGSPLTADMPRDYPPLGGYVRTQPREDPKITYALGATEDEPLLAHWFVGRGQVAAFTSDASTWARQWLNWPGYARMWTQIARTIARPAMGRDYELTTEIVGDELVMRLEAFDAAGRPIDLLTVPGSVFTPDEGEVGVRLAQVGPGTYEARAPATLRGNYVVTVSPRRGEELLAPAIGGASRAVGPEFRSLRSNATLLREIAETTGGRVLTFASTASDELFARDGVTVTRAAAPLWRSLLAWCFVIFLLDVGTRRVAWDRLLSRDLRAELSEHAADLVKGRADAAARMTDRLRKSGEGRRGPAPTPREPAGPVTPPPPRPARSAEPATQDDEAARLERMKALRARMLSELRDGSSGRQRPTKDTKASEPENEGSTADLLAAKRRARARYREDDQATD